MDRIDALRAFVRVVERGSFTAVAEELRVKQSTVSKWVAALEAELDVRLLDRTTRSQHVTDAGQRFYESARVVLSGYDEAVAAVGNDVLRGRIRISIPAVFGRLFVVPLVAKFLRQNEEVEAEIVLADRYVRLVEEGFDVAIRIGAPEDSSLISHTLGESERRLVAAPRYLAAHGTPTSPRDLARHECLVHTRDATWRFTRGSSAQRVSVRGRIAVNNSEATVALAKQGFGVCLLASWLVDKDIRAGRLVRVLEDWTLPAAPIRALTPPGRRVPPHVRALIDHLREEL